MGFFTNLFSSSEPETYPPVVWVNCPSCGDEVDEDSIDDGKCESCRDGVSDTWYCCGQIYEEGETVCRSCGEPPS